MNGHWLLRRFGLARANDAVDGGARHVHEPLGKIDVAPFQAEQLALPQAGRHCKEDQRSFSNAYYRLSTNALISAGIRTVGALRRFAL
jgi:hypothetical protein